jgi:hypothetical protein
LKLEIEELGQRITEQDILIATQIKVIEKLEAELLALRNANTDQKTDKQTRPEQDDTNYLEKLRKLERDNELLTTRISELGDYFDSLRITEKDRIERVSKRLGKYPATPELKGLIYNLDHKPRELDRARLTHSIGAFQAFEELRDLCQKGYEYLDNHPRTVEKVKTDEFRARLIIDSMEHTDVLTTPQVVCALSTIEGKKIFPIQARSAMEKAAEMCEHLKFEKTRNGKYFRIIRLKKRGARW